MFRVNTTGVWDQKIEAHRAFNSIGAMRGVADIIGLLPGGRFIAIEVKTSVGRVSDEQQLFLDSVTKLGGLAFVARSLNCVKERLNGIV